MTEDSQLVLLAHSGDVSAFGELVRRYQADVRSFLRRRVNDAATADDLAQEVFIGAMNSIAEFNQQSSVRTWLMSIARFKLIDYLRKKKRESDRLNSLEFQFDLFQLKRLESSDVADDESVSALNQCIAALKPDARSLVRNFYFEDQSANSIAEQLQQKPGAIRMSLLRIRKALAQCIRKRVGGDWL